MALSNSLTLKTVQATKIIILSAFFKSYGQRNLVTICLAGIEIWPKFVILQVCDIERLRSSVKVKKFSIRSPPPTCKYTCEVLSNLIASFSFMVEQLLTKGGQLQEKERREHRRNNMMDVHTL